ncbi:MAG: oligosaccharide flippase family protein [Lachnospiraceae bacterium]|nr:oligosaccharide flippase family protein [Lachnospiraceae bacterium]
MKKKSTIQNIFFNTFGSVFYYGCQWLITVLVVRIAGYDEGGNYNLAMTFTAWLGVFALYNTRQFQVSDVTGDYLNKTYINSRLISSGIAIAACLIALPFNHYSSYKFLIILMYMVFKIGEAFVDVFHGIDQKAGRMDLVCYSFMARGVLMLVSFCGVLYLTKNQVYAVLAMVITTFAVIFAFDIPMANRFRDRAEEAKAYREVGKDQLKNLMIVLLPLVIVGVTNNLSITLPKYFLERFLGSEALGYYSSVATPSTVVQLAASTVFVPLLTPLAGKVHALDWDGFYGILKKVSIAFAGAFVVAIVGAYLLGDWFLKLLFPGIDAYTYLFVPVVASALLISVNASLFSVCTVLRELKGQVVVGVVGLLVSMATSIFFIPSIGMDGVLVSLYISLGVQIIIELICIIHKIKVMRS